MVDALDLTARSEAAAWLARMRSEARTPQDEAGFQEWLGQDPRHRRAFDLATSVFEAAGAVGSSAESASPRRISGWRRNRREMIAGGVAATAAVVGAAIAWGLNDAATYHTAVGEQRRLTLSDGSQVILDTDTLIKVAMSEERRRVELRSGRAHFIVAKDPARPFIVRAGAREVIAVGTAFSVALEGPSTAVVLEEGRVIVRSVPGSRRERASAGPNPMSAGERLVFVSASAAPVVDRPDLSQALAWREGRAVFENETLGAAALELNRYSRRVLDVSDPAVATLRVSGVFRTGDPEAFARTVTLLLPLEVEDRGDRIVLHPRKVAANG